MARGAGAPIRRSAGRLACSCRATSAGKCAASAQFCREGYYCIISVFWLLAAALLLGLHAWYGIDRQVFVSFPLLQCMSCSLPPLRELQLTCFVSSPSLPRLRELTSPSVTHHSIDCIGLLLVVLMQGYRVPRCMHPKFPTPLFSLATGMKLDF